MVKVGFENIIMPLMMIVLLAILLSFPAQFAKAEQDADLTKTITQISDLEAIKQTPISEV